MQLVKRSRSQIITNRRPAINKTRNVFSHEDTKSDCMHQKEYVEL